MTSDPGQHVTYFSKIEADECWALLSEAEVGRIAWQGDNGISIVPVNFRLHGQTIVFQTADGGSLARLVEPTEVAFQADDIDGESVVGWSVQVQGLTRSAEAEKEGQVSWLAGSRPVWIAVTAGAITGRVMSGTKRS
ncbi:Pyridoxamine 5'-phosphate oxidase [Tessaracoccus bendigoensis DSM 12906]|uniref:Pyridoxamine 5'-phosphate oxidase n=1 Tax=Tessaracoccus bendigoensis DSM 12906 TaxID=1123357 RepID=A0A1M6M271_9ACTN|nr:pyridoxamine 5'-phosphate oxidase family protein [Tessaracoccus bendigoensis]SHJ77520.1 Pyridoxamine 5'-phosphate oxidase [Tessaracoccus bendigoensis DSM 12906]